MIAWERVSPETGGFWWASTLTDTQVVERPGGGQLHRTTPGLEDGAAAILGDLSKEERNALMTELILMDQYESGTATLVMPESASPELQQLQQYVRTNQDSLNRQAGPFR